MARFSPGASEGFDPERDLERIRLTNQTTMLRSESLEIAEMMRRAMADRYGEAELDTDFRGFETICSATQDRQDAVETLLEEHDVDLMLVVGGYNSSNTRNLARIGARRVPTYHIVDAGCLVSPTMLRHRRVTVSAGASARCGVAVARDWLPLTGRVRIGLTAGASTPDSVIGCVAEKLEQLTGSNTLNQTKGFEQTAAGCERTGDPTADGDGDGVRAAREMAGAR